MNTREALMEPAAVGVKLRTFVQDAPAAKVTGLELVESCSQVELLPKVKPVAMLGLSPDVSAWKILPVPERPLSFSILSRHLYVGLALLRADRDARGKTLESRDLVSGADFSRPIKA